MSDEKSGVDVVVVGAGVIGLAVALEMHRRGARVIVVERDKAVQQASIAAAGMLAVNDPANPPALLPLALASMALYPDFLRRLEASSGLAVPFQTKTTVQYSGGAVTRLAEKSIDPRQLSVAMLAAVRAATITLLEETMLVKVEDDAGRLRMATSGGEEIVATSMVYATGAWTPESVCLPVTPRKGQMLRVRLPQGLVLNEVHRSEDVYVVPRTAGPQAGTALIGATVENVGFDVTVHDADLARLRGLADELVAGLEEAAMVEAWAGLRPGTPDDLPLIGEAEGKCRFIASGHYRNGVLLAPATAVAMADMLMGKPPDVDLSAFSPRRFGR